MASRKPKEEPKTIYQKPKTSWLILIGENYYFRLTPLPFKFSIDLKHIK